MVVLSVVPVLVVVYSAESLTALAMFDSDLWVAILLPHYLNILIANNSNTPISKIVHVQFYFEGEANSYGYCSKSVSSANTG